jgi:hypothetical protein
MIICLQGLRLLFFFRFIKIKLINFKINGENLVVYLFVSYYNSLDK